ncbi:MAG: CCA tRNA nucleotidyltransferase [Dehalococcoidia bacterium]|nr:CCA tRNA nucleotidyltransferase [Dehalococcoidia bacterium]
MDDATGRKDCAPTADGEAFLGRVRDLLGASASTTVDVAAEAATAAGLGLYLVGGTVRDVLLGFPTKDVDLSLVGNAISFGAALARTTGGRVTASSRFGTVSLRIGDMLLDVVTARSERYARPGALPQITPSGIDNDLLRRDFSVNAIAFGLSGVDRARFRDPAGGIADVDRRVLRALHPASFQDDPTRMLRATRYSARLGFSLDVETTGWMARDAGYLTQVSNARRGGEFRRILAEAEPEHALALAHAWGLLALLHSGWSMPEAMGELFAAARSAERDTLRLREVYVCLLLSPLNPSQRIAFTLELQLPPRFRRTLFDFNLIEASMTQPGWATALPSKVVETLTGRAPTAVTAWRLLAAEPVRSLLREYEERWHFVRPLLGAAELEAAAGLRDRALGQCLAALRAARLDGAVVTRDDELALVRRWTIALQGQAK